MWTPDPNDAPWTPDRDETERPEATGGETAPATPEIVLDVETPILLRLARQDDDRLAAGMVGIVTRRADCPDHAPIALMAVPAAVAESLLSAELFAEPVPLRFHATLAPEGLHGTLVAQVPLAAAMRWLRAQELAAEPWRASVEGDTDPTTADAEALPADAAPRVPIALGTIWRFEADCRHPGNIVLEAADLLMALLEGRAVDADQRRIDHLLASL